MTVSNADSEKEEDMAAALYEKAVVDAIRQVMGPSHSGFLAKAKSVFIEHRESGGVDKAAQIVLEVASGEDWINSKLRISLMEMYIYKSR